MQTTILLVEDDAVLRGGLAELFTREGYRVIEAASVREAKEKLNSEVQAVLLDVGLPDGDGVTLCRAWREAGEQRPILFLTAKDEELDVVRALDSGGNDYVTKPFRMQELLSRVRVLLRSTKPQTVQRDSFSVDESKMQIVKDGAPLPLTLTADREGRRSAAFDADGIQDRKNADGAPGRRAAESATGSPVGRRE